MKVVKDAITFTLDLIDREVEALEMEIKRLNSELKKKEIFLKAKDDIIARQALENKRIRDSLAEATRQKTVTENYLVMMKNSGFIGSVN